MVTEGAYLYYLGGNNAATPSALLDTQDVILQQRHPVNACGSAQDSETTNSRHAVGPEPPFVLHCAEFPIQTMTRRDLHRTYAQEKNRA